LRVFPVHLPQDTGIAEYNHQHWKPVEEKEAQEIIGKFHPLRGK